MTRPVNNPLLGEMVRDHLIDVAKVAAETRRRLLPDVIESVAKSQVAEYETDGWVVDQELKLKTRMRRAKPHDVVFEDRVWAAFARLGFTHLNRARSFKLNYGNEAGQSKRIDVFAADEEVVLVVECRSASVIQAGQFKKELEATARQRAGVLKRLEADYPRHKVKFILATNNFSLSETTKERIRRADVFHIDESGVDYFLGLAEHLGAAAKYQLLGALFAEQEIPNLEPTVPAIRGAMGGLTYFSFSIEPARLLKMAYILHRNQANSDLMPTYQRLIKKTRLKKVADFVEAGGFFPNSIILNVETKGRTGELPFDLAGADSRGDATASIGLLHLPRTYRAAYVIDGQHRLYGYANSSRADSDLIPVVAFVDLPRAEQVRLFMQINENQQAVPKNLRNTLNADLLYESEDPRERIRALRLSIAQHLGEQKSSPLYDRVIIGENAPTSIRCISIDAISNGLNRGNFIGTFVKAGATSQGTFYAGDNDTTAKRLTPFLEAAFAYLRDALPLQWRLGSSDGGFVFRNNGTQALMRLLSDVVDHVKEHEGVDPLKDSADEVLEACTPFLDSIIEHLEQLSPEEGSEYRKLYGDGGAATYYRRLQVVLNEARPEFQPDGLREWVRAQDKQFVTEATGIVQDIEELLKTDIRARLQDEFGADWWHKGVPRAVRKSTTETQNDRNLDRPSDDQLSAWDCMYLIDYRQVLTDDHGRWQRRFEKRYTRPGDEHLPGSWRKRLDWLKEASDARNDVLHGRGISDEKYALLTELKAWLITGERDNDL